MLLFCNSGGKYIFVWGSKNLALPGKIIYNYLLNQVSKKSIITALKFYCLKYLRSLPNFLTLFAFFTGIVSFASTFFSCLSPASNLFSQLKDFSPLQILFFDSGLMPVIMNIWSLTFHCCIFNFSFSIWMDLKLSTCLFQKRWFYHDLKKKVE